MSEPRTPSGRHFLARYDRAWNRSGISTDFIRMRSDILAIEQASAASPALDVRRGAAWAVHFAVKHLLSHRTDDPDLSLAIELMKAIRDEPDHLATLFERWELDPDAALTPEGGSETLEQQRIRNAPEHSEEGWSR